MSGKPSKVLCSKCGAPGSPEAQQPVCAECGGRVVRVCGACGFKNSAAKNYCDVCGERVDAAGTGPAEPRGPSAGKAAAPVREPPQEAAPVREPSREAAPSSSPEGDGDEGNGEEEKKRKDAVLGLPKTMIRRIAGGKKEPSQPKPEPKRPSREDQPPPEARHEPKDEAAPAERKPRSDADEGRRAPGYVAPRLKPKPVEKEAPRGHKPERRERLGAMTLRRVQARPVFSTVLGLVLLIVGALLYAYFWQSQRTPGRMLLDTTVDYLVALKERDYAKAYALLSADSRSTCPLPLFKRLQDDSVWQFDDVRVEEVAEGRGFARYKLFVSGKPAEEDWLHLVLEDGAWRRAYWWHLIEDIETAIERRDYTAALGPIGKAARINPLDPMVNAYLCETAYHIQDYAAAARNCARALKAAKRFPSRLGRAGLIQLHTILADLYRNHRGDTAAAEREYGVLLGFPDLSSAERCDLLLARADSRYDLGGFERAVEDFDMARGFCRDQDDIAYLERAVRVLSARAGSEAVALVERYRLPGGEQTLLEWRARSDAEISKRLKTGGAGASSRKERWIPEHVRGGEYRVSVRDGQTEVLTAKVDLWTHRVEVDIHVQ
ncbi:MAG: hypothetical protein ABII00_18920 [Elusimicrobiota bacterium]